jgi:hypothetical protein
MIEWIMTTNTDEIIMDLMSKIMADHTLLAEGTIALVGFILYLLLPRGQYQKVKEWWTKMRSKNLP